MDKSIEHELLNVVGQLSPREVQLVIEYARVLRSTPISEVSRAYLETLAQLGASSTELLRAAQAIQRAEEHLSQGDSQALLYDLEQRTDNYMNSWFRERGFDYEAITEQQFDEVIDKIIHQRRQTK
ncbi:MAG: hypothetical protein HYR94_09800 [Chloroflexi bacterium]|nr:hypothetical protein [Chloroflexota bacterium]